MYQTNPRFQETMHANPGMQETNPLQGPTATEPPPTQPSQLQAQQASPIEDLAARVANLQARQASLEAQQTQQATPTTPSPTAQRMPATPQPSQPQPSFQQGSLQGIPQRLRSMIGLQQHTEPQQPTQQPQQSPRMSPVGQGGGTMHPGMQPPHPQQQQPQPFGQPQPTQGQQSPQGGLGPQVSPFQGRSPGTVSPMTGGQGQLGQQGPRQQVRQPPVDILDEGEDLVLEIEMPGVRKEDIHLRSQQNALQLRAQTRERREEENLIQSERGQVLYQRSIPLGVEIDTEEIEANFEDGLLRVKAPKRDPTSGPRRIQIN